MLFQPENVEQILSCRMTQIRKNWENPMVKVGSIRRAKTALFSKDYFASITITGIRKERLGDISIEDVYREGYDDFDNYKAGWIKINGFWDPNCFVYVVSFELKERYDPDINTSAIRTLEETQIWDLPVRPVTPVDS